MDNTESHRIRELLIRTYEGEAWHGPSVKQVSGRDYNYYVLLHGIVQHDLYHLGQISLLRKLKPL